MNSSDQVNLNLIKAKSLLSKARNAGADACFLPENFAFMGHPKELLNSVMEDEESGIIQTEISNIAKELKIWIIAGSIPIRDSETGKAFSRSITYNDDGEIVGHYDKVHLFDVEVNGKKYHESEASMLEFGLDPSQLLGSKWDYQFAMTSGSQSFIDLKN